MKLRRGLNVLAVFLVMSGSLIGSEREKRLQVQWSALGKMIGGKRVALQLAEGERVEGRVRKVTAASLVFKVKKSSNVAVYPKGRLQIPREAVSRIEARSPKKAGRIGPEAGRIVLTGAAFVGTLLGSIVVVLASSDYEGSLPGGVSAAMFGVSTGAAVLVYRALRPKGVTLIEILPDSHGEPGEQESAPAKSGTNPVAGALRIGEGKKASD